MICTMTLPTPDPFLLTIAGAVTGALHFLPDTQEAGICHGEPPETASSPRAGPEQGIVGKEEMPISFFEDSALLFFQVSLRANPSNF